MIKPNLLKVILLCNYRKNDKCPPWELASKMIHDNKKKTIYYDNAIVKVYNVPIFIFQNYLILTPLLIEDLDF